MLITTPYTHCAFTYNDCRSKINFSFELISVVKGSVHTCTKNLKTFALLLTRVCLFIIYTSCVAVRENYLVTTIMYKFFGFFYKRAQKTHTLRYNKSVLKSI